MRLSRALVAAFVLLACSAASACAGSGSVSINSGWTDEPPRENRTQRDTEVLEATPSPTDAPAAPTALIGVRHDIALAPEAEKRERCACLAVEVGSPGDPRFQWRAGAPEVGQGALAVALSARGVACPGGPADPAARRPSISAVDVVNDDVILEVEEVPASRPLAEGAIIARPGPQGGVYVRPRGPRVPYARTTDGRPCRVQ